jgi:hypothetical protein
MPSQVRLVEPPAGHRRRDGAEPAPIQSCSTQEPRRRCTPTWGRGVTRSMPSQSSETRGSCRSCGGR